jgi:hypothetical protein
MAYNAFSFGGTDVYVPLFFKNYHDLNGDIPTQNIDSSGSNVIATYYQQVIGGDEREIYTDSAYIDDYALHIFYPPPEMPNNFLGAAVITDTSSSLIALLNERKDEPGQAQYMTYNGVAETDSMETSYKSHVPILYRENHGTSGWQSSIQAQNTEEEIILITAEFYDQSGDYVTWLGDWVQSNGSMTFYLPVVADLGDNYVGSAKVEGYSQIPPIGIVGRKLIAIANVQNFSMSDDGGGSYNGFNR